MKMNGIDELLKLDELRQAVTAIRQYMIVNLDVTQRQLLYLILCSH